MSCAAGKSAARKGRTTTLMVCYTVGAWTTRHLPRPKTRSWRG
jgi:hypothetical protein